MMWAVFLTTARPPPPKVLNRAFLVIQDFEFTRYPAESQWTLITSTDLPTTTPPATPVPVPLPVISNNVFASLSPAEINTFICANEAALSTIKISRRNWLIIDQHGLETSTCLVCEHMYDPSADGGLGRLKNDFRACRVPYEVAWLTMANLDVGNMEFEVFVDEDAGIQEDGSWRWRSFPPSEPDRVEEEADGKREAALAELKGRCLVE
ncbi:hypothetical protein C8R47DRAFT_748975 [Mycena vitilis]|nr:hypothetical protein C8R47DRAFT_748975 [Mycena vitilis]